MSGQERGAPGLLLQFLTWIEVRPRSYGETMDAWRTSCPRLSIWEDAVEGGFVALDAEPGEPQRTATVVLTDAGRAHLACQGMVSPERVSAC